MYYPLHRSVDRYCKVINNNFKATRARIGYPKFEYPSMGNNRIKIWVPKGNNRIKNFGKRDDNRNKIWVWVGFVSSMGIFELGTYPKRLLILGSFEYQTRGNILALKGTEQCDIKVLSEVALLFTHSTIYIFKCKGTIHL